MNPHVTSMFTDSLELLDIEEITQRIDDITDVLMEHKATGGISDEAFDNLLASVNGMYGAARLLMPYRPRYPDKWHDNDEVA